MMALRNLLAMLSLSAVSAARMVIHESRLAAPNGFISQGAAPADDMLTLRFALASNNIAGLKAKLMSLSTPGSPEFRQWLSKDEVKAFVQPSPETVTTFDAFASANGLKPTVISPNGDWMSLTLPVSQANKLFAANFEVFTHPSMAESITRTLSVSLPSELVGHIDVVHPSTEFVPPNPRLVPVTNFSLEKRIPSSPATQPNNTLLVTGYVGEFAQSADLSAFLTLLRPDIPSNTTFNLLTADGGTNPQSPNEAGVEANLDIQYTMGIATGVPTQFLSIGGSGSIAGFATSLLDTTTLLDGIDNPPSVMTTSYGSTESSFGSSMAIKICNGYMALGSRGISVLYASGDGGVRGNHDSASVCNNVFMPVFPAACPFVTSVGSTQGFGPEVAINFTGGGFSNFFPAPDYQTAAIAGFLETSGRGYPDVALQGWNFEVVSGVLGFLNPFIYSTASTAFTDITIGHNSGFVCPASSVAFDAAVGWDPLTGFGTPVFSDLLAAAMA
ncbi:family S53 protease-like protein [Mycena leptocephala]|nr:family S53 protease-like protein [Mycena leptocephala]